MGNYFKLEPNEGYICTYNNCIKPAEFRYKEAPNEPISMAIYNEYRRKGIDVFICESCLQKLLKEKDKGT